MSNPLSFLPFAIAAANGRVEGQPVAPLIAAGLTLLQRSAPLVRALTTGSPAILLPHGAAFVTALAACEGHAALWLDPSVQASETDRAIRLANATVVLTESVHHTHVSSDLVLVLLDHSPREAWVRVPGSEPRRVDLGSHVGLRLEGERETTGSDSAVLRWLEGDLLRQVSHRQVLAAAHEGPDEPKSGREDAREAVSSHAHVSVIERLLCPLLRGESC